VGTARDAVKIVSDITSWEAAWHKKTDDIVRLPKALGALSRGGADDPLGAPHPIAINFPMTPTGINVLVPKKGQETGRRFINLEAVCDEAEGIYRLVPSAELSEAKLAKIIYPKDSVNEKITAIRAQIEFEQTADGMKVPFDEIMKKELRATPMGDGHYLYMINIDDSARMLGRMKVQTEGTYLARVDTNLVGRALMRGPEYPVPMTYLPTREFGAAKFKRFEMSEKGVADLVTYLDGNIRAAKFKPTEEARAQGYRDKIAAHFAANVEAFQSGATGVACLLPAGQGEQTPDLLSMAVYHAEEDQNRAVPLDGIERLKAIINMRGQEFGSPMGFVIFKG
jgi:hypothetical protein